MRYKEQSPKTLDGFFSIEASMVFPLIYLLTLFAIIMLFFLYNHMIVYQSCYIAALRGQQVKEVSDGGIEKYVKEQLNELLENQIYEYQINGKVSVNMLTISVSANSSIINRLSIFELYEDDTLESDRSVIIGRYNPSEFIRKSQLL